MNDKLTLQERILCADLSEIDWNYNVKKIQVGYSKTTNTRRKASISYVL